MAGGVTGGGGNVVVLSWRMGISMVVMLVVHLGCVFGSSVSNLQRQGAVGESN